MIAYDCPECGAALQSPDAQANRLDTCPDCGATFVVPAKASGFPLGCTLCIVLAAAIGLGVALLVATRRKPKPTTRGQASKRDTAGRNGPSQFARRGQTATARGERRPARKKPTKPTAQPSSALTSGQLEERVSRLRATHVDGRPFHGVRRAGTNEPLLLVVESSGSAPPSPAGTPSRQDALLGALAANATELAGLSEPAAAFVQASSPEGKARRHVLVFPRRDLAAQRPWHRPVTFDQGSIATVLEAARRFGVPTRKEVWSSGLRGDTGLGSPVLWWHRVGLAQDGRGAITHVLLRGP